MHTSFRPRMLPPADVVVRYNVALMDPCNRQFHCLIPGFLRVGKIALDAERAHFAIPVRDIGCRRIPRGILTGPARKPASSQDQPTVANCIEIKGRPGGTTLSRQRTVCGKAR